jgi:biopolymer transport protein ExbB/TolQ
MSEAFNQGGIIMYPLLVVGIGILFLSARAAWLLSRREAPAAEAERSLQGVLFWGAFSVVLGLLGTTIGLIQISQAIILAGRVEPTLVWGGFGVALVTLIFGLLIFLVAGVLWFALRQWSWRRLSRERSALAATM